MCLLNSAVSKIGRDLPDEDLLVVWLFLRSEFLKISSFLLLILNLLEVLPFSFCSTELDSTSLNLSIKSLGGKCGAFLEADTELLEDVTELLEVVMELLEVCTGF